MGLIPFWRFPSDAGAVSFTSSTAGAGFAGSNVQKQTLQKKWKTGSSTALEILISDFGSSIDIDTFAMFGFDLLETDALTVSYSDDPLFLSGVTDIGATWHADYVFEKFDTLSARYRRVAFTKDAAASSREIGRIVDGTSLELENSLKTPGDMTGPGRTTSTKRTTSGGQQYGNTGTSIDVLRGTIPGLDADDIAELNALQRAYQTVTPFVTVIRAGLPNEFAIYGTLDSMQTPRYVTPDLQEIDWRVTEQK